MNLQGDELYKITTYLENNLTKEDPLSQVINSILELVKIPDLGGLLGSFSNFLPQSLTQVNAEGIYSLLNPDALGQVLQDGLNQVTDSVKAEITNKLNEAIGIANNTVQTATQAAEGLIQSGLSIATLNLDYLTQTADQFFKSFNITGQDLTSITSVRSAATSVIENVVNNLTPKQIRDLQDPAYFQQVVDSTLDLAKTAISTNAIANAIQQIEPSKSINSVVKLAQKGVSIFNTGTTPDGKAGSYELLAEVHVYYARGDGADADAAQKKSVSGQQLQSGVSCGVDNSTILIGSTVETSLGTFKAVDKTKIASSSGLPPVNLFYDDVETAALKTYELSSSKKAKQIVKVTPPGSGSYVPKTIEKRGLDYDLY